MNYTSRAANLDLRQIRVRSIHHPGFETPTYNVEPENTRSFILIKFAAGSLSKVTLDERNVFQSCDTYLNVRSLFALDVARTVLKIVFLGNFCSSPFV